MQTRLVSVAQRIGPVLTAVAAVFLIILGVLVIVYPELLEWVLGLSLILFGVALLTTLVITVAGGGRMR